MKVLNFLIMVMVGSVCFAADKRDQLFISLKQGINFHHVISDTSTFPLKNDPYYYFVSGQNYQKHELPENKTYCKLASQGSVTYNGRDVFVGPRIIAYSKTESMTHLEGEETPKNKAVAYSFFRQTPDPERNLVPEGSSGI